MLTNKSGDSNGTILCCFCSIHNQVAINL